MSVWVIYMPGHLFIQQAVVIGARKKEATYSIIAWQSTEICV